MELREITEARKVNTVAFWLRGPFKCLVRTCSKMNEFPELSDLDAAYSSVPDMGEYLADNWNISLQARRTMPADMWARIRTQFHAPGDFQARPRFRTAVVHAQPCACCVAETTKSRRPFRKKIEAGAEAFSNENCVKRKCGHSMVNPSKTKNEPMHATIFSEPSASTNGLNVYYCTA